MSRDQDYVISVEQLQVGVYVYLDVGWMHHPFSFNNFKIRSEEQLATIRMLGLKQVRWDPSRSDLKPLEKPVQEVRESTATALDVSLPSITPTDAAPSGAEPEEAFASGVSLDPEIRRIMEIKRKRVQQLAEHRANIARVEEAFGNATNVVRGIDKTIYSQPDKTLHAAGQLIGEMVDELLAAPEIAVQVMAEKPSSEESYFHSLNVSVLAMILARELKMPAELVRMVGMGGLFHDIGLNEIPAKIRNNPDTLTKAERDFRELHCQYGYDIGKQSGLPPPALNIIFQHHEHFDGSGYPKKLKGETIDLLARLVAVINIFDNICNPVNIVTALTPHEAVSQMFSQKRSRFDPRLLQAFIRFMGVYPPGTVVGLSNESLGLVIKVNSARPLKPTVIMYDADVPKHEAIILDLEDEADINISRAIRPGQLAPSVFDYLSPRKRVSYYFDAEVGK